MKRLQLENNDERLWVHEESQLLSSMAYILTLVLFYLPYAFLLRLRDWLGDWVGTFLGE